MKGDVFMRYSSVRDMDVVNGIGIACSLFVQGCTHHCYNCFNQETWDFKGGEEWTKEIGDKFISLCNRLYIDCVSILGGEPMQQDASMAKLLRRIKEETSKSIWLFSGDTFEVIMKDAHKREILSYCDVLVDGPFVEALKDLRLRFRGSSNQRIIDVQPSLKENKPILLNFT